MKKNAIIDTSVLICLHHLKLLQNLNLVFSKVFVPREVEKEFLTKHKEKLIQSIRYEFLEKFYLKHSVWFEKCQAYNSDIIKIYQMEKKLDAGEIEVFAQNQEKGNNNILLLDEKQARKVAERNNLAKNGVLYVLAFFDVNFKIVNYFEAVDILRIELNTRFSDRIIKTVYNTVRNE